MNTRPLRTLRQPAADVNGRRGAIAKRRAAAVVRRAVQSQANFTANTAAMTSTPAEQSFPRPASTLMPT